MRISSLVLLFAFSCASFSTAYSQNKQVLPRKPVQQKAQSVIDMATIVKQKIDLASLPDAQQIRTSQGTIKTVGQIKREYQNAKVAIAAKEKSVAARTLRDFETYRKNFLSSQTQAKKNIASENVKLVARIKRSSLHQVNPYPQTPAGTLVKTPVITSLDRDHGMFGEAVLITGSAFDNAQAQVKFMVSANTWKEGGISYWSDTQIIATVPDNTGNPDYDGFLKVEKTHSKESNPVRFRITSDEDVLLLSGTGATVALNGSQAMGTGVGCMDRAIEHRSVGSASDIMVYHDPGSASCGSGCNADDFLWQNLVLKNGWVVDNVVLTKVYGEHGTFSLKHSVLGTDKPTLQVVWNLLIDKLIYDPPYGMSYQAQVYLRGPKGVPYK